MPDECGPSSSWVNFAERVRLEAEIACLRGLLEEYGILIGELWPIARNIMEHGYMKRTESRIAALKAKAKEGIG